MSNEKRGQKNDQAGTGASQTKLLDTDKEKTVQKYCCRDANNNSWIKWFVPVDHPVKRQ